MNKIFSLLFVLMPFFVAAQVVTTIPAFVTTDYSGAVTIIFDATQGNRGLINHTGDVYAHTGVITNRSTSDSDWRYVKAGWSTNSPDCKLTNLGNNLWQLDIIPSIREFYGVPQDENIEKLAFVFRSSTGNPQGKDVGDADIFVELQEAGAFLVRFNSPAKRAIISSNTNVSFIANASEEAHLELFVNSQSTHVVNTGTSLTYSQIFSQIGDYQCIIVAALDEQVARDTVTFCILSTAPIAAVPAGKLDGINYDSSTEVTLVMYAKDKNGVLPDNVIVVGDFNDWNYSNSYQMKRDGTTGRWWVTVDNLTAGEEYAFQYVVKKSDGSTVQISDAYTEKVLDPWHDRYLGDIYPNLKKYPEQASGLVSILQTDKPQFEWSEATLNFVPPHKDNLVIYELWVHDFSKERTINEVTARLDYLQNLGVNAIELMPIHEFDGNISWGYNPNHFFAADKAYGTKDDYKRFIDSCHNRGIAVLLDVVYNHATRLHPFAKLYWNSANNKTAANNPWFNVDAPHPWSVFHDFNHTFSGTKEHVKRSLKYWLEEYKIDGYRLDLTKGFTQRSSNESTAGNYDADRIAILKEYYDAAKSAKNDVIFILEHFCADSEENELANYGMLPWRNINNAYSQTAMGWLRDGDSFSGANVKNRISYAESHDEERNFFKAKEWGNSFISTDETARLSRVPANLAFISLLQGSKMIWQFGELGYDFSIDYNGRTGPKPLPENLGWFQNETRMNAYKNSARAIRLRTELRPEIFTNGTINVSIGSGVKVRTIVWEYNGTKILAVANFDITNQNYTMPAGSWYDYLNNNAAQSGNSSITLQQGELRIFTTDNTIVAPTLPDDYPYSEVVDVYDNFKCTVFPTITNSEIYIESSENIRQIDVYSLRSEKIMSFGSRNSINVSALPSGMYLMVVTFDKRQEAFKFIRK